MAILPDTCKNSLYNTFPLYRRTDSSNASKMSKPFTVTLPISFSNGSDDNKSPKVMLPEK